MLNAIGQGKSDVAAIRAYLNLDSGLMSRLLRGLEAEGMVIVTADPEDGRRRLVAFTPAGAEEFAAYEELSNDRARALIASHPHPEELLKAMDLVASALGRQNVELSEMDPRDPQAVYCLGEYYGELNKRLSKGFEVSLSCDPEAGDMMRPRGAFFVAFSDGMPLGCAGLKGTDKGYAEIKRLWVSPAARGLGLARRLMSEIEETARALAISTLRLDTNSALPEAVHLYQRSGWQEIPRFNTDPYPDKFFEKVL